MSIESSLRTYLLTDATLVASVGARVYAYPALKRGGLTRANYPEAYGTTGLLLACLVIKARASVPDRALRDSGAQVKGMHQIVQCQSIIDGDAGYITITTIRDRVRILLDEKRVASAGIGRLVNRIENERDTELNDACFHRDDFEYVYVLG